MNTNITLGAIIFLLWAGFSTWYYTCNIKGECLEIVNATTEQPQETVIATPDISVKIAQANIDNSDTIAVENTEELLPQISITENKIHFTVNSSDFSDPSYVEEFVRNLKSQIDGRAVEIKIIGFTCDLGKSDFNINLGLQRAQTMQSFLIKNKIIASKMEVLSEGEILAKTGTDDERKSNRKVTITIKSID